MALTLVTPLAALSGCVGGPIAQQLIASIVTRGVDKIAYNAYEARQRDEKLIAERSHVLKDTTPDPYYFAFATAGFETISPVIEPLPDTDSAVSSQNNDQKIGVATVVTPSKSSPNANHRVASVSNPFGKDLGSTRITRLVRVEIWNLVIGDEKNAILEKARLLGEALPPKDEWHNWKVANGAAENEKNKPITFLIPPDLGSINSGDLAVVEITELDHLHVARYAAN